MKIVDYNFPPIDELIFTTGISPPLTFLRSEHIGLYWSLIKGHFPKVSQDFPFGNYQPFEKDELQPLPRYIFNSIDNSQSIQIQKNAFIFNWRNQNNDIYPRYRKLKSIFDTNLNIFTGFVKEEFNQTEFVIKECHLTYVNIVNLCDLWTGPNDTCKVIKGFKFPDFGVEQTTTTHFVYDYNLYLNQNLTLKPRIEINYNPNSREPQLLVTLQAIGTLDDDEKSVMLDWFDHANKELNKLFDCLTTDDIQRYWNKG